jgi:hypothetical protein
LPAIGCHRPQPSFPRRVSGISIVGSRSFRRTVPNVTNTNGVHMHLYLRVAETYIQRCISTDVQDSERYARIFIKFGAKSLEINPNPGYQPINNIEFIR